MTSLFTIDTSELLAAPVGTLLEFNFSQDIPSDTWGDLVCIDELNMTIKLMRAEYGIECVIGTLNTTVNIPSEGIEDRTIDIENIHREFHMKKKPEDTDDIEYISDHDGSIDLTKVIEQELLIAGL